MVKKIAFIGLGIMGKPMAKNLVTKGHQLTVFDVATAPVEELKAMGASAAGSPAEAAEGKDIVITMLPNSEHVKGVALGESGIHKTMKAGSVYIDMSSINPNVSREVSAELEKKGIVMFDAPVSGGEGGAIAGKLVIMVGGPADKFDGIKETLECMGTSITYISDIGSGNIAKLANQMITAANLAALSEAFTYVAKSGVDPEKVYNAIKGGAAGSNIMNMKIQGILDRNFKPGFKTDLMKKDITNAVTASKEVDSPVKIASLVLEILTAVSESGFGGDDHSGMIRYFEKIAGTEVKKS